MDVSSNKGSDCLPEEKDKLAYELKICDDGNRAGISEGFNNTSVTINEKESVFKPIDFVATGESGCNEIYVAADIGWNEDMMENEQSEDTNEGQIVYDNIEQYVFGCCGQLFIPGLHELLSFECEGCEYKICGDCKRDLQIKKCHICGHNFH